MSYRIKTIATEAPEGCCDNNNFIEEKWRVIY